MSKTKKTNNKKNIDYEKFIKEKGSYIQSIIRKTISSIKEQLKNDLFSNNDTSLSINVLSDLYEKTNKINQKINNKLLGGPGSRSPHGSLPVHFLMFFNLETPKNPKKPMEIYVY